MKLRLLVSEAWRSLGANISTTFAAMMTVLIGMFLLGLLIALGTWTLSWSDHVKSELVVKVDMTTSSAKGGQATHAQEEAIGSALQANPLVARVVYVPKSTALKQMDKLDPQLVHSIPWNPLPDEFQVTPKNADDIQKLDTELAQLRMPGIARVIDGKVYSDTILRYAHVVEVIFLIAISILLTSASLLIANTIRLSIFSRRREIEVMKLVGATNWFVRGPFMLEGLLCGVGGSLLAVLFLVIGKEVALPELLGNALSSANNPGVHALDFPITVFILLGMGVVLGAVGSGVTVRRFLQV